MLLVIAYSLHSYAQPVSTVGEGDSVTVELQDTLVRSAHTISKVRKTIRGFDRLQNDYIEPQHYELTVMGQVTRNFESFRLSSNGQSVMLAPDQNLKIGPYFGWRWFFLGYSFDLNNIGISKGGLLKEIDLNIYSSQLGVDLYYKNMGHNYKLRDVNLGDDVDCSRLEGISFDGVKVSLIGATAYYIFNHGRFSYPAAFSQSTCQKVSCGSWMAGAGYTKNVLDVDFNKLKEVVESNLTATHDVRLDSGMMFDRINYNDFSLSCGYAYNWVFARNWLFCASGQMALAYKTSYGKTADEKDGFDIHKVNPDAIGRFALVYNNTRWYAGMNVIFRTNNYHTSRFNAYNVFGSMYAYLGYNFWLKKKYRKKE